MSPWSRKRRSTPISWNIAQDDGTLVACALTDRLKDGLSMVYSFFHPGEETRSLGTYMILDHVRAAREQDLPYVYLGYWVRGSEKMDYKIRFSPLEALSPTAGSRWRLASRYRRPRPRTLRNMARWSWIIGTMWCAKSCRSSTRPFST